MLRSRSLPAVRALMPRSRSLPAVRALMPPIRSLAAVTLAAAALAALATLAAPPVALAAEPPTILTAGIDAAQHLHVTWSLGAGTAYERAAFATAPEPHPFLAGYFADESLGASDCAGLPGCLGTAASTSYRTRVPVARGVRYFVQVAATAGEQVLSSAVWVIDDVGRPFAPAPSASLKLLKLPVTISSVLSSAVRVRVGCSASCDVDLRLSLDGQTLARRTGRLPAGAAEKLALRPTGAARPILRARSRARLRVTGSVTPLGGPTRRIARAFAVRR